MQNSLGVFRMAMALMRLNHRGREQQQGGSNQTSWHFKIDSETSLENMFEETASKQEILRLLLRKSEFAHNALA
jgi:hypothetical protein